MKELCNDNFQIKTKHISKTHKPRLSKKEEAVQCQKVEVRDCDEVPDDYQRAGIGHCFKGNTVSKVCLNNCKILPTICFLI